LLALEQHLADTIFDDETDAAPRFREFVEFAVGARSREWIDEKVVRELPYGR
jgi:hypothetical protein